MRRWKSVSLLVAPAPKGRLAEDGTVPDKYPLNEIKTGGYMARTEQNVIDSNGTLVLNVGRLSGGTKRTVEFAHKHGRPCLIVQIENNPAPETVVQWLTENDIRILNIAGPRESKCPGVHVSALEYLRRVFHA